MAVLSNPTDVARETLKQLAARRIAPTPENYQRLYHEIAGTAAPREPAADERILDAVRQAASAYPALTALSKLARALQDREHTLFSATLVALASGRGAGIKHDWSGVLRELIRQLEARQTATSLARKKEGLERLLANYGTDTQLFEKLQALVRSWGEVAEPTGALVEVSYDQAPAPADGPGDRGNRSPTLVAQAETMRLLKDVVVQTLDVGVAGRLTRFPELEAEARALAQAAREARGVDVWGRFFTQLRQFFYKMEIRGESDAELLDALLRLLGLLVNNIGELVDDDQWLSGQLTILREVINSPLTTERIGEAERRFKEVIYKQGMLKHSLNEAKSTLKNLIAVFVERLAEMSASTSEHQERVGRYAGRLEQAQDIGSLKTLLDELMSDTRSLQVDMLRHRDEMIEAKRIAEQAEGRVRKLEAELELVSEQISQDQLTGALNRRGLEEAMEREIARAERGGSPLCVAVLDLDNFKRLNDTHGHQAGDDALVHLIGVVRKTLRPTDIVARYGGEEFIVLFSDTPLDQAVEVMRRLQRELTKRFFLHNNERLLITFSAGVAAFQPGDTQEMCFARADKAMYQAKLQGKNRVVMAES
jgi:diguanylate cyclase